MWWQKRLFCCLKQSGYLTTRAFFEVFLEVASVARVILQVLEACLCQRGKYANLPFFAWQNFNKSCPCQPHSSTLWALIPLARYSCLCTTGAWRSSKSSPSAGYQARSYPPCSIAVLLQMVTRCKLATLVSEPNRFYLSWEKSWGRLQQICSNFGMNTRRKLISSLISSARKDCPSALSPRWNVAPTWPHFL